jgi:protein SEY1
MRTVDAASHQALEEGKRRLREFLEASDTGREAIAMSSSGAYTEEYEMSTRHNNISLKKDMEEDYDGL